jgi:hypothetical protein
MQLCKAYQLVKILSGTHDKTTPFQKLKLSKLPLLNSIEGLLDLFKNKNLQR